MSLRVLHVITDLGTGGAEMMLLKVLTEMRATGFESAVVSLRTTGDIGARLQALGIPVEALGMGPNIGTLWAPLGLRRRVKAFAPDVVQGWMYHGNLFATLALWPDRDPPPHAWNIRQTLADIAFEKPASRLVIRANAALSRRPDAIVYNARASVGHHVAVGFSGDKTEVIANGFDTERFRPLPEARRSLRAELDLPPEALVIGYFARFHPQKDHATFFRAAGRFAARHPDARFLLAGSGVTADNDAVVALAREAGVLERCRLLGKRDDMPEAVNAVDISTLTSSHIDAFPNVIGESMACGVPCVATDIGDVADIVGDLGVVVPIGDAEGLAEGWASLAARRKGDGEALAAAVRESIVRRYALSEIARQYAALYRRLSGDRRGRLG